MRTSSRRLALGLGAFLQRNRQGKILFYHDLFSSRQYTDMGTPFSVFQAQIDAAGRAGFTLVSHAPTSRNEVQVCLDDGFRGVYDCAEWFVAKGAYPTIFIVPDLVGSPGYLAWSEIRELQAVGFSFQSHTWSHRSLTEVADGELAHELGDSRSFLSDKLGRVVTDICFPRGLFSNRIVKAAVAAGYDNLVTSVPGAYRDVLPVACPGAETLRTRNLVQFLSPKETVSVLKGGMRLFQRHYLRRQYVQDPI